MDSRAEAGVAGDLHLNFPLPCGDVPSETSIDSHLRPHACGLPGKDQS